MRKIVIRFDRILMAMLLGTVLLCNGCVLFLVGGAAAAAGVGAALFVGGELKDSEAVSIAQARVATLAAFKELQCGVVGSESSPLKQVISARSGSDQKITVTLEKESPTVTKIGIRVGVFGDEPLSRKVLERIKSHLGLPG